MSDADVAPLSAVELARLRRQLDRQDIDDCLARIARGTDRFDRDLFLLGFHPGASISLGGAVNSAEDAYEGGMQMHAAGTFATLHCLSTSNCEFAGDTAHAETYHIYAARTRDEINWAAAGRYIDQFERRDGVWAIVFRHIAVEWSGTTLPNGNVMFDDLAKREARLRASRDRNGLLLAAA
ncbi:MAG: nuclear transport factor 2 family protein [Novosphingobium sp.]